LVATIALLLVTNTVAAQSLVNTGGSYQLRVPNLEVRAALHDRQDNKPSFVAPLIITAAGFATGASAVFVGLLSMMGTCSSPSKSVPRPGTEWEPTEPCDRSIPTPMVVTAIAGGSVGVLGAIWLVERIVARRDYNREQRGLSSLHVVPTAGGAALFGRF
jgi:hypothetical protein